MAIGPDPSGFEAVRARLAALKTEPEAVEEQASEMADALQRIQTTLSAVHEQGLINHADLRQLRGTPVVRVETTVPPGVLTCPPAEAQGAGTAIENA